MLTCTTLMLCQALYACICTYGVARLTIQHVRKSIILVCPFMSQQITVVAKCSRTLRTFKWQVVLMPLFVSIKLIFSIKCFSAKSTYVPRMITVIISCMKISTSVAFECFIAKIAFDFVVTSNRFLFRLSFSFGIDIVFEVVLVIIFVDDIIFIGTLL